MNTVIIRSLETEIFRRGGNLREFVVRHVPRELIEEKMLLAVTSKIVSLAEERLVPRAETGKGCLVRREADHFLGEVGYGVFLTIKEGLFIPSAGIDESNSEGDEFILYPADPFASARKLWEELRAEWGLNELGLLITDSHTSPLRRGVTGICLSFWGFRAVRNMIGTKDLFGRELQMTRMNLADSWSAAVVGMMGEGAEGRPLAVVHGADLEFCGESSRSELQIPLKEDLYYPFFQKALERS